MEQKQVEQLFDIARIPWPWDREVWVLEGRCKLTNGELKMEII
jgi:hypothetical protein